MFVELFNFGLSSSVDPLNRISSLKGCCRKASTPEPHTGASMAPDSLFELIISACASSCSCSAQNWWPCRRTISFPKHGTVTAPRLCLEVWPSQPRSPPVLDLLFHSYSFLTETLPKATALVPSFPNFQFSLGLLEPLSLHFQCWPS